MTAACDAHIGELVRWLLVLNCHLKLLWRAVGCLCVNLAIVAVAECAVVGNGEETYWVSLELCHLLCCRWVVGWHRPHVECAALLGEVVDCLVVVSKSWVAVLTLPLRELCVFA